MDVKLNELWKMGEYPFNQITYSLDDLIKIDTLHKSLIHIVGFLKIHFSNEKLFINHDWHEHDGYVNQSDEFQWSVLEQSLENTQSLYNSRDGDYYVYITIYPESLGFILRYDINNEDDDNQYPGIWGDFDLTIDKKYSNGFNKAVEHLNLDNFTTSDPKHYFDCLYGG